MPTRPRAAGQQGVTGDPGLGRRGSRRHPRCAVPDRRVPDRLRHQHQHECERGHRRPRQRAGSAKRCTRTIDVNMGQSSNDVIPTAIHVSAALTVRRELVPALEHLRDVLSDQGARGRRYRQDRAHASDGCDAGDLGQELSGWRTQIENGIERLRCGRAAPAGACPGRHGGWHRHQCAPGVRQALLRGTRRPDRRALRAGAQLLRGACPRRTPPLSCPGR